MCTGITITRYVPLSQRTNIAGSNIVALAVVTMEILSAVLRNQGNFQKDCFFKGLDCRNMTLVPGDYLWCRRSVQYFLTCYEEKNLRFN